MQDTLDTTPTPPLFQGNWDEYSSRLREAFNKSLPRLDADGRTFMAFVAVRAASMMRIAEGLGRRVIGDLRDALTAVACRALVIEGVVTSSSAHMALLDWASGICHTILDEQGLKNAPEKGPWHPEQQAILLPAWERCCVKLGPSLRPGVLTRLRVELEVEYNQLAPKRKADGPAPDGCVYWKGKVECLQTIPHRLLSCIWGKESLLIEDLCESVWGQNANPSQSAIKTALGKANSCLMKLGVPWSYKQRQGRIVIST
jgi:hypothetical protein